MRMLQLSSFEAVHSMICYAKFASVKIEAVHILIFNLLGVQESITLSTMSTAYICNVVYTIFNTTVPDKTIAACVWIVTQTQVYLVVTSPW
jgi:hypothetical protein